MPDVVVAEVRGRHAKRAAAGATVKRGRDPEVGALPPDRIVVVGAVEADDVVPLARLGPSLHGPFDHAVQHDHLHAQFADGVLELCKGLVRRVHGDHGGGGHAVCIRREQLRLVTVEGSACRDAGLVVRVAGHAEAGRRKEDREVDAELRQALVEELRHHGGGAITGVFRGCTPERLLGDVFRTALRDVHRQRTADACAPGAQSAHRRLAADPLHGLLHHRTELQPVAIGIDHRMPEARAQIGCLRHDLSPLRSPQSMRRSRCPRKCRPRDSHDSTTNCRPRNSHDSTTTAPDRCKRRVRPLKLHP